MNKNSSRNCQPPSQFFRWLIYFSLCISVFCVLHYTMFLVSLRIRCVRLASILIVSTLHYNSLRVFSSTSCVCFFLPLCRSRFTTMCVSNIIPILFILPYLCCVCLALSPLCVCSFSTVPVASLIFVVYFKQYLRRVCLILRSHLRLYLLSLCSHLATLCVSLVTLHVQCLASKRDHKEN